MVVLNPVTVKNPKDRVSVMVSMAQWQKKRFTMAAAARGLTMSAFLRIAAEEYIKNHGEEGTEK